MTWLALHNDRYLAPNGRWHRTPRHAARFNAAVMALVAGREALPSGSGMVTARLLDYMRQPPWGHEKGSGDPLYHPREYRVAS